MAVKEKLKRESSTKTEISPILLLTTVSTKDLVTLSNLHNSARVLERGKEFHPRPIQWEPIVAIYIKKEQKKNITCLSILLVQCHPSVKLTVQSNLTRKGDANTRFLAKISTAAS